MADMAGSSPEADDMLKADFCVCPTNRGLGNCNCNDEKENAPQVDIEKEEHIVTVTTANDSSCQTIPATISFLPTMATPKSILSKDDFEFQ